MTDNPNDDLKTLEELEQMISATDKQIPAEIDAQLQGQLNLLRERVTSLPPQTRRRSASKWRTLIADLLFTGNLRALRIAALLCVTGYAGYIAVKPVLKPSARSKVSSLSSNLHYGDQMSDWMRQSSPERLADFDTTYLGYRVKEVKEQESEGTPRPTLANTRSNTTNQYSYWNSNDLHRGSRGELNQGKAPVVSNVPDIVIGDAEAGPATNLFAFPGAVDSKGMIKNKDEAAKAIKWNFGNSSQDARAAADPSEQAPTFGMALQNQASPSPATTQSPSPLASRQVIYTANIGLLVTSMSVTMDSIRKLIDAQQGFIGHATLMEITFRVPPAHFDATLDALAKLGDVLQRDIKSDDVTDQYRDLALRIDVAKGSRKRLMDLLSRTGKLPDVLEVERQIRRLTEEIEGMEGSQRVLGDQIAMTTINVSLAQKPAVIETPRPVAQREGSPFEWVNALGIDRAMWHVPNGAPIDGGQSSASWWQRHFGKPKFHLGVPEDKLVPSGFVPLLYDKQQMIATTPDDNRLRIVWLETRQEGDLDYWMRATQDEFTKFRGYAGVKPANFELTDKQLKGVVLRCQMMFNGKPWDYELWLVQKIDTPKVLTAIEYARPTGTQPEQLKTVEAAVRGIEVN